MMVPFTFHRLGVDRRSRQAPLSRRASMSWPSDLLRHLPEHAGAVSRTLTVHRSAIVVGIQNHREADRIVRLLVPERGESSLARSAQLNQAVYGALDIGNRLEVSLRPPKSDGWWGSRARPSRTVASTPEPTSSDSRSWPTARRSAASCPRGQAEPKLYGLLDMALTVIDALSSPPSPSLVGLETKALTLQASLPDSARVPSVVNPWTIRFNSLTAPRTATATRGSHPDPTMAPGRGGRAPSTAQGEHRHPYARGTRVGLRRGHRGAPRTPLAQSLCLDHTVEIVHREHHALPHPVHRLYDLRARRASAHLAGPGVRRHPRRRRRRTRCR